MQRGVAVDRNNLLEVGNARFTRLLKADAKARSLQRVVGTKTDLTSWPSVEYAFQLAQALEVTAVPPRKSAEIIAGRGKDRDEARSITGFHDLWKANQLPQVVKDVYAFHDRFATLVFGQSMLDQLSPDGRLRSHLFCGGRGPKVAWFADWLEAMPATLVSIRLLDPLWGVLSWLCEGKAPAPDLAREWFPEVRSPSLHQRTLAQAVWHGFLLGYDSWDLWQYVGRLTRTVPDQVLLSRWRNELSKRYPMIALFHKDVARFFFKPVGFGAEAHHEFEPARYRAFVDHAMQTFLDQVSGVVGLAIEEMHPGGLVARFQDWLLCETKKPDPLLHEKISQQLATAFPKGMFQIEVTEVQP